MLNTNAIADRMIVMRQFIIAGFDIPGLSFPRISDWLDTLADKDTRDHYRTTMCDFSKQFLLLLINAKLDDCFQTIFLGDIIVEPEIVAAGSASSISTPTRYKVKNEPSGALIKKHLMEILKIRPTIDMFLRTNLTKLNDVFAAWQARRQQFQPKRNASTPIIEIEELSPTEVEVVASSSEHKPAALTRTRSMTLPRFIRTTSSVNVLRLSPTLLPAVPNKESLKRKTADADPEAVAQDLTQPLEVEAEDEKQEVQEEHKKVPRLTRQPIKHSQSLAQVGMMGSGRLNRTDKGWQRSHSGTVKSSANSRTLIRPKAVKADAPKKVAADADVERRIPANVRP